MLASRASDASGASSRSAVSEVAAMEFETISVVPSAPHIGAEIGNIDLRKPLSNRQVQEVHEALLRHGVIFFREQDIDFDQHVGFARQFGPLHIHVGGDGTASQIIEGHPEIRRQHFDEHSKRVAGESWHTDQTCADIPPMGSILYQKIVPPNGGGDTLFASMYAAYDALSPQMKAFLEPLTAEHDGALAYDKGAKTVYPVSVHPVITRHPETGKKVLFVSPTFTSRIMQLPKAESDAVLGFLFDHIADPHWQVRFRWTNHSIAFWDNRCTQHCAIWDYWPNVRSGFRVQIKGTARPLPAN
jgi:taurine dioxygenase